MEIEAKHIHWYILYNISILELIAVKVFYYEDWFQNNSRVCFNDEVESVIEDPRVITRNCGRRADDEDPKMLRSLYLRRRCTITDRKAAVGAVSVVGETLAFRYSCI